MSNDSHARKKWLLSIIATILVGILSLFGINIYEYIPNEDGEQQQTQQTETFTENDILNLTMVDVGQADGFVFMQDGKTAVIDCGTRSTGKNLVEYLKQNNVTKLDYVVGTHPHDDHMGGMYDVITNFEVGEVIIPKVTKNNITTNWYLKLMNALKTGGYKVTYPNVGDEFTLGKATMKVIAPFEEPESNLNNYSIVLKVSLGEMDVIMTGDMEKDVEKQILAKNTDIDAEILKLGHHGSDTSSCVEFIDTVSPQYALCSSKVGNKYEHPIKSTMDNLKERNIPVYRTDESGTVVVKITPKNVEFSCSPGDYLSGVELEEKMNANSN
jgi:beta-lactamase superfamily II metal-dependent hydrolase